MAAPAKVTPLAPVPAPANRPASRMELRKVRKSFGAVQALRGVDLDVRPGEVHAIVGENGAGKSTLIGVAAGVLAADFGTVSYDGKGVAAPTPALMRALGVSVVYQHPALAPDLTVLENLQLVAETEAEAVEALLRQIATEQLRVQVHLRVAELTLAQLHVVEIARALVTRPKVLIFDEPTEPFQQSEVGKLFELIRSLRAQGVAIVYVSHRLHEVMELADRVSVMRDGQIIDSRPAKAITTAEVIGLIAGRPLGQMFPPKSAAAGGTLLEARGMTGRGFSGIDMVARAGEIVGLAGVEGEGQREFLRALAGLEARARGTVVVGGRPVGAGRPATARAGIGFVSDDRHAEGLFLALSLRENLGIGILDQILHGGFVDRPAEKSAGLSVVERLRIRTESLETPVSDLSGGNQQKVLIGREMATNPKVLLVDEPTKGVDVGARAEIYQRLRALAGEGLSVVVSSSDGIELEGLCDRVLIFARGQIVKELRGPEVTDAAITEANLTATAVRSAVEAGVSRNARLRRVLASDHFPAVVLAALTGIVVAGMAIHNSYFLTSVNIADMLSFLALLAFVSIGQLSTILVGGVDLSVGALAGLDVVLASFLTPDQATVWRVIGGSALVILFSAAFGLFQGFLVARLQLPAIIVTLATFIGLQGVSLALRPNPNGTISDTISDSLDYTVAGVPAGMILALIVIGALEFVLYRRAVGRSMRAVGSSPLASVRLGVDVRRNTLLAFAVSGVMTGIAGVMLAGQIGIGSADTGVDYTIMSITAVVLGGASIAGGRGSIICTLLGGALVQATSSASSFIHADSSVHYSALGLVTILAAVFFSVARRPRNANP